MVGSAQSEYNLCSNAFVRHAYRRRPVDPDERFDACITVALVILVIVDWPPTKLVHSVSYSAFMPTGTQK